MALTAAEKQRAYRERTKAERKVVEPGELIVGVGSDGVQSRIATAQFNPVVTGGESTPVGAMRFEPAEYTPGAVVSADALLKLVDELYLAGMFRGSLARIKLRAFAKGE